MNLDQSASDPEVSVVGWSVSKSGMMMAGNGDFKRSNASQRDACRFFSYIGVGLFYVVMV